MVDLVDTLGCLDDCQRKLRVSGVAVLFLFLLMNILIGKISKSKKSSYKWWGPVADMIVELLPLHILYSTFLSITRSNMIFTSTSFCSEGDQAFFAVVCTITFICAIFSIFYISFMKFIEKNPPTGYKVLVGVSGIVVFLGFVVYLLLDNSLPLDSRLCYASVDDIAEVMKCLHIVRAVLSTVCAIAVVCLWALPELWYMYYKKQYPMTQARLEAELRATLVKQLKEKLKNLSDAQSVDQVIAAAQSVVVNLDYESLEKELKKKKIKPKVHSVVKSLADRVIPQSEAQSKKQLKEQLKTQSMAVAEDLLPLVSDSVNINIDQLVDQLVDQFVAAELVAQSVAQSVASKCKMHSKVLAEDEWKVELNTAKLVDELRLQSKVQSVAAQLLITVIEVLDEPVNVLAEHLSKELKVKWCC